MEETRELAVVIFETSPPISPLLSNLELVLKSVQIGFYVIMAILAVLTYRSAKNGLLNTINTEYFKKVLSRLEKLSDDLFSEFDPASDMYWGRTDDLKEIFDEVHEHFDANKDEIVESGDMDLGVRTPQMQTRIRNLILKTKSDPFLPSVVRDKIVVYLEARNQVEFDLHFSEMRKYYESLAAESLSSPREFHWAGVSNAINSRRYEAGFGISHVEEKTHELRLEIQAYMKNFDPFYKSKKNTK